MYLGVEGAFLIAQLVKNLPAMQETPVQFLGEEIPWRRDRLPTPVTLGSSLVVQMVKNLPTMQGIWVHSLGWEDPWRRAWQPAPVFLPGEFHGQSSLAGYSPWGCKVGHTEWLCTSTCVEEWEVWGVMVSVPHSNLPLRNYHLYSFFVVSEFNI